MSGWSAQSYIQAGRALFEDLEDRPVDELEDQVELFLPPEGVLQVHDVGVVHQLEVLYFPLADLLYSLVGVTLLELFDCDYVRNQTGSGSGSKEKILISWFSLSLALSTIP